jgi:DNA-binding transcriptional ArsR family regulator
VCMNARKLICHKICEALRLPTRVRILQELIKAYPNRLTISKLQEITSEPRMTIWFHINKLRESNLVELDGSRRGFRAATRALTIRLNGNGIHLEAME